MFEDAVAVAGGSTERIGDELPVTLAQRGDVPRGVGRLLADLEDAGAGSDYITPDTNVPATTFTDPRQNIRPAACSSPAN